MPLKILMLNSGSGWFGEVAHTLRLAVELQKRGHDVVLCARPGSPLATRAADEGVWAEAFELRSGFHPGQKFRDIVKLRRLVRDFRPDVIHCHRSAEHWLVALGRPFLGAGPAPQANSKDADDQEPLSDPGLDTDGADDDREDGDAAKPSANHRRRAALVRTRHIAHPYRRHLFNRWLLTRGSDAHIAVSQAVVSHMNVPKGWVKKANFRTIYSGVDLEAFNPDLRSESLRRRWKVDPNGLIVGLIGRFQKIKGQQSFLDAAALLRDQFPDVRFLVCGRGSQDKIRRYRAWAVERKLDDRLIIETEVEDIAPVIASLDIGVVASLGSEGSSRVGMEYQASGVPVVATRVGSLPEIIDPDVTGLLIPSNNPKAMAEAIGRLLADEGLRKSLGAAGREHAETAFGIERWIDQTLEVYLSR